MEYRIYKVSAYYIVKVVELYEKYKQIGKDFNASSVARALDTSEVNARNAIKAAEQLGLMRVSESILYASSDEQRKIFRKMLQSYNPFLDFVFFLNKGDKAYQAVRKIIEIYNINRKPEDILWTFKNWGIFAGIFKDKGEFEFSDNIAPLKPKKINELSDLLDNEIKIMIWVKKVLGEAESYLSNDEYEDIIKAISIMEKDPRNSIKLIGEVLEDILRRIAVENGIDVGKKNGISEIATELRKHKILASKHIGVLRGIQVFLDRDIFDGLSAFRNMAHHSLDKYEMKKWELSEELALSYLIQVILCIKSMYFYVTKKQLKF